MKQDNEGFMYPHKKDEDVCGDCGRCNSACFYNDQQKITAPTSIYACKIKDDDIRKSSSSGGVFSALAERVISQGGVVFGAAFDENCILIHSFAEGSDYVKFRRSKYVESDLKETYPTVQKFLDDGRKVLFTGTPCKISGLLKYLRKSYENLLCMDFICHGVPSPLMLKIHLDEISKDTPGKIIDFRFRTKDDVWKKCISTTATTDLGNVISKKRDSFMLGFLQNLYLRPSCHSCFANGFRSGADITIGDYWGAETMHREFDDEKGVSLLMIRSKKGEVAFEGIKSKMEIIEADLNHILIFNPNIERATSPHPARAKFFDLVKSVPFSRCVKKFTKKHIEIARVLLSPGQIRWIQFIMSKIKKQK